MTRVRKVVAVGLLTPMATAAIAVGLSQSADAADACPPLASASITPPKGTVTAGSSVHVSAQISGLMLLQAHLQISGPGLDKQVGNSVLSGAISGDVTVPKAGYFTLAVVGNGTKCAYQTAGFSVKDRASASKPTHGSTPGKSPQPGGGSNGTAGGAGGLPSATVGGGGAGGNNFALNPLNGASPFSLPSVAPDGSAQGFEYPSPDPQVASPPTAPVARNVTETTPVKWGQSLAIALVLLVISAHLGMWSRRQRLATEGAGSSDGATGRRAARKKSRASESAMAATATLQAGATTAANDLATTDGTSTANGLAETDDPAETDGVSAMGGVSTAEGASASASKSATNSSSASAGASPTDGVARTNDVSATDAVPSGGTDSDDSGRRGYHGRRRRG